jgi:hypothetical protein
MPANNPNAGIPSVDPAATAPDRYQRIDVSGNTFGAQIGAAKEKLGQGEEKLGAGLTTAGNFFGKVAADDASNQFQDFSTKILHGDPTKPGPDGQPDLGYMGLRGEAALRARPDVEKQIDEKLKEIRGNLTTPDQQLEFDNFSKRYRANLSEKVGTHADGQATVWYQGVNTATSKLALDHISNNFDNPNEVAAGFADVAHAYVKNAQLAGASEGSPQIAEAVSMAKRDALAAQLNAMAVKDPSRAMAVLDKNREIAGVQYDNLAASFRSRAKQQQGYDVGDQVIKSTYTDRPAPNPAILTNAGAQYGISGGYLQRVHQLEGNGTSPTGAQGPFQFIPSTAAKYGLKDPFNYEQSAAAAAHLAADNKVELTGALGRPPTDPELYLAHQQGATGAAKLLANPNVRAGDLVGDRAIRVNGGDPNQPAIAFTGMWTQKFNVAPQASTENRRADAYQKVLAIPEDQIDPDVRQHALTHISQTLSAQAVAEEQDAKAQKAKHDQIQSDFTRKIIMGQTQGIIGDIANSGLPSEKMENLYKFATGEGGVSDPLLYGPKYTESLNRILAKPDDPSRINGPDEIIRQGATGELTHKGVGELLTTMDKLKKQPDQAGIATVKASQLKYYQSKMAIDDEMSAVTGKPFKNQKGLDVYNHEFVPAFEAAYSQWIAKGKDPMEFLSDSKQMDAIMDRVYPPARRAADAIGAGGGGQDKTPVPPPEGVEAKPWGKLMGSPPNKTDGTPWNQKDWSGAIGLLRQNPTPETIAAFNAKFGPSGYTAEDILKRVPPKGYKAPEAPATVPEAQKPNILEKALGNVIHYGQTGHGVGEGYTGEEVVPLSSANPANQPQKDTFDEDLAKAKPVTAMRGIPVRGPVLTLGDRG